MPEDRTVLYTLLGVLLILIAVYLYSNRKIKEEQERGGTAVPGSDEEEGDVEDPWLLKFVHHDGGIVGETFARDGDDLILKQAGIFKAVPKAMATIRGDEIVLKGEIDWDAAMAAGTAWHQAHTKGHDPLVTEHLTKSEDVRNPAMEATKSDEEE